MGGKSKAGRDIINSRLAFQGNKMSRLNWSCSIVLVGYLLLWGISTLPVEQKSLQKTDNKADVVLADAKASQQKPVESDKPKEVEKPPEIKQPEPEVQPSVLTNCEKLELELRKYDWDVRVIFAIARAENGTCDPARHNETSTETHKDRNGNVICVGSYGALQVGCLHYMPDEDRSDLATNVKVAYRLWSNRQKWGNGYEAWTMYTNGRYLKNL